MRAISAGSTDLEGCQLVHNAVAMLIADQNASHRPLVSDLQAFLWMASAARSTFILMSCTCTQFAYTNTSADCSLTSEYCGFAHAADLSCAHWQQIVC